MKQPEGYRVEVDENGNVYAVDREFGGPGSGNWGHIGIPGWRGGSQKGSGGIESRPDNYAEKKGVGKTEKKEEPKKDNLFDENGEEGASVELANKLNSAFGEGGWISNDVSNIRSAKAAGLDVVAGFGSEKPETRIAKRSVYSGKIVSTDEKFISIETGNKIIHVYKKYTKDIDSGKSPIKGYVEKIYSGTII
jgi:hypothetical protein